MRTVMNNVRHLTQAEEIAVMKQFTDTYRSHTGEHIALREAACLRVQFPAIMCKIQAEDLFAGRMEYLPVGFSAQSNSVEMCYCADMPMLCELAASKALDAAQRATVQELIDFWQENKTHSRVRSAFPEETQKLLPSDAFTEEPGIGFPLYRLSGSQLDFGKLLELGIPGMRRLIDAQLKNTDIPGKDDAVLTAMQMALDTLAEVCRFYQKNALELRETTDNAVRKQQLTEMAAVLENIAVNKPATLREAIQLVFLYWQISGTLNFGRMDTYLGDFYTHDVDSGTLTEAQAAELMEDFWILMAEKNKFFDTRVIVGGKGRKNEQTADRFALLAMETTRRVKEVVPQLTLRFYEGMNPLLMEKALEVIGEGRTFPMLYNDDLNVDAVMKAFDIDRDEAEDYAPFGCGEYVINHKSFGTPSGLLNLTEALLVTMNNGREPATGVLIGLETGRFEDFNSFEAFYEAYCTQLERYIRILADHEALEYVVAGEQCSCLFLSMLFDDCIARGQGLLTGGIRYLGGTLELYGNTNAADSLTAIKELVYEQKKISPARMLDALGHNFVGYEQEQRLMLGAPKYGNDDDKADQMVVRLHEYVCNTIRNQRERTALHNYMAVIINNRINTGLGLMTGASPDGRQANTFLANANNPHGGMDKSGITAMLNSLVKPDVSIHAGSVQNMKFSRELFGKNREKLVQLLRGYFSAGGSQAMITVLGKGDLENAMKEPEKYGNLIVRVGGFSARFVELSRDVQLEILSRTLY